MGIVGVSGDFGLARRIAVYGELDSNLVDGSSVWLQSICEVLASIEGVEVTLLLRRPLQPERSFLFDALAKNECVEVVDSGQPELLDSDRALDLLEALDRERGPFDLVVLRGQAVLTAAARRGSFEGRLWAYAMTGRGMADETLRALGSLSARLLCQTEAVAEELREIVPSANGSILVLPPMIPDSVSAVARVAAAEGPLRLVYSGKIAPEYCWSETVEAFVRLRRKQPKAELHVLGDKVHRPPGDPDFHEEAMRSLHETEGLRWHGAVPRADVHSLLAECDLALSIRKPDVEAAREISTKVLEYGAAGLPVVLNRAPAYERLLGESYPLFVSGPQEATDLLTGAALDRGLRVAAAAACHAASRDFTFDRIAARLSVHMPSSTAAQVTRRPPNGSTPRATPVTRVLIAGHDLKFVAPIREAIAASGATLAEDVWTGHTEHDEAASRAALESADTILCEWCLGNAAWYSRNKRPDQRLVVRFHRVELETDYPAQIDLDGVDAMVFVAQHVLEDAAVRFGWDSGRLSLIPNAIDCERLWRPKSPSARFTLALIGYVPMLKRLDRALDILESLRQRDPRFRMVIVGRPPSDFDWVVSRQMEVDAFRSSYARIQESDLLRAGVEFRPFTTNLPDLFGDVGWIVSTSDVEGHQVTLAEGAASGAIPVILDRQGAEDQYPRRWVYSTTGEAASAIGALGADEWTKEQAIAAEHARRWSTDEILPQWVKIIDGRELKSAGAPASEAAESASAS